VWSFGILAFEVFAQQEPHSKSDPIQIGQLIRNEGLTPQLPNTCPTDITSILKSCWNIEPSQRPTIDQITQQLELSLLQFKH